jgi:Zn-dependent M28 family amino/carboxypeptidase
MRLVIVTGFLFSFLSSLAQSPASPISESNVSRIEKMLASDDMQGRKVFTPGIEKAAVFINNEFKDAGLQPWPGATDFNQTFTMVDAISTEVSATVDGNPLDKKNVVVLSADSSFDITETNNYRKVLAKTNSEFSNAFYSAFESSQPTLIFVDTSLAKRFSRLSNRHIPQFAGSGNRLFILTAGEPKQFRIQVKQTLKARKLTNLIGIVPGKMRPDEYVIFSAHYDHLGIGVPDASGDSIFNGANDDASGVTGVITLAHYFAKLKNNQRTLVFVTFTAEEIGEFGSAFFSRNINPDKVVAMLNIEMIGTESKWGKNSAYITGYDKTDMGTILQKNLMKSPFRFYPDPYPEQQLFLRSDNSSLAKKGVPAHTISTSKMDSEKYYHTQGDAVETLDLANMTEIIQAIGLSAGSIISGEDTPLRVKIE